MFSRLFGSQAAPTGGSHIADLVAMGFTQENAQVALEAAGGDVQRAAAMLLEQQEVTAAPARAPQPPADTRGPAVRAAEGRELARARSVAPPRQRRRARQRRRRSRATAPRSAAATTAGAARRQRLAAAAPAPPGRRRARRLRRAARAASSGAAGTPEERVQRAAARLAGHAAAVDILVTSLTRVLQNPADEKYRTVNIQNKHFQSTVAAAPGGMEFMYAVGFEPMHGHLVLQSRDPALVWIGKSALEQLRGTSSYGASKEALQLQQALALSKVEYETHDEVARAAFLLRVPEEPPEGAAGSTKICVHVGQEQVWRRFESCNTLEDLLNFVRSLPKAPKRDLVLDNITTRPPRRLDTAAQLGLTLQRLDMWPSGHVAVSCGA